MDFNEVVPELMRQIDDMAKRIKALEDAAAEKPAPKGK